MLARTDPFEGLPRGHYGAILADPPWKFVTRAMARCTGANGGGDRSAPYPTMDTDEIAALPVASLAVDDCVLFLWACWPHLEHAFRVIEGWGFTYKTCAFSWMKADPYRLFADEHTPFAGLGYWTRANTEPCLLATRGNPKRLRADVRQGIIAPRREHSRKPDEIHERIERLVAGPYLELFARGRRVGWDCWGNETDKFSTALQDRGTSATVLTQEVTMDIPT
jgi:N6-adenosine-specific RNA methylase IME4